MRNIFIILLSVLSLCSCNAISSLIHDDEVVAKVGKAKLYRSDLEKFIPDIVSIEDSTNLAARYIHSWALDRLYAEVASSQLPNIEMDIDKEMEAYRMSLIKYRYEQIYINDRLDTLVTDEQIKDYYQANLSEFKLSRPILKVRFINIMSDSASKDRILKNMASDKAENIFLADSLAKTAALRYFDNSDTWMDAAELAKAFGVNYTEMLAAMKDNMISITPEGRGDLFAAYVCEIQRSGTAPIEYCSPIIHDIIISNRRVELIEALERDLIDNALKHKNFVIY